MVARMTRRIWGALALMAMLTGLTARADYIIIQVNLNGEFKPLVANTGGAGAQPGGMAPGGASGSPPGGGMGMPPGGGIGMPPSGGIGMPGGMRPGSGGPGDAGLPATATAPPEYVFVVVEISKIDLIKELTAATGNAVYRVITNAGSGFSMNYENGNPVFTAFLKDEGGTTMPGLEKRLGRFVTALGARGKTRQEEGLETSMWALQHGMLKRFEEGMADLRKDAKNKAPAIALWGNVAKALEATPPANSAVETMRQRFPESRQQIDGKYCTIVSDRPAQTIDEVRALAKQVDDQVRSIYAWFAYHGITVKPLRQKLLIVMGDRAIPRPGEERFPEIGGATNLNGATYSIHQTLVNDPHLRNIQQRLKQYSLKGWNLSKLIKLEPKSYPDIMTPTGLDLPKLCDVAYVSMLNVAAEALRAETDRATRTFLVGNQMLPMISNLPDGVIPPAWLEFGLGAAFQTPTATPWTTLGMGHSVYLPLYKELARTKKLEASPVEALRNTVRDTYFRQAANIPTDKLLAGKARATAWAFFYYAARKQPEALQAYFKELAQCPRDIELSEEVLWGCFERSFLKDRKLPDLAREWDTYIRQEPLEGERMFTQIRAAQEEFGFERAPDARRNALMSANGLLFSSSAIIQEAIRTGMTGVGAGGAAGGMPPGGIPGGLPGSGDGGSR